MGHEQTMLYPCAPPLEIGSKRTKPGTNRSLDGGVFQTDLGGFNQSNVSQHHSADLQ